MDLYDYPSDFPPRIPDALSRSARVWCLGAIMWMGLGLFLLLLSFAGTEKIQEWGGFCTALNPGVLRQAAVALLVYGWGMPMMWGLSLLRAGGKNSFDFAWTRAGAWGWHSVLFVGTAAILSGSGSGIQAMPFPAAIWPVLVLSAAPVFYLLVRALMGKDDAGDFGKKLQFMSALSGMFYLIGGTVSVFFVSLPPYYRTVAAECTTCGLSAGILSAFALTLFLPGCGKGKKEECICLVAWLVFVLAQSFSFAGFRSGMLDNGILVVLAFAGFCGAAVLAGKGFRSWKRIWPGGCGWVPVCFCLWGLWYLFYSPCLSMGHPGWVPGGRLAYLLLMMMGFFAVFPALFLYERVPCCSGRDWLSARALFYPLLCWMIGIFIYGAGMFAADRMSGEDVSLYWTFQSRAGTLSVLMMLAGWLIFSVHVVLVWSGRGRIAAVSLFGRRLPEPVDEVKEDGDGTGKGGVLQ